MPHSCANFFDAPGSFPDADFVQLPAKKRIQRVGHTFPQGIGTPDSEDGHSPRLESAPTR